PSAKAHQAWRARSPPRLSPRGNAGAAQAVFSSCSQGRSQLMRDLLYRPPWAIGLLLISLALLRGRAGQAHPAPPPARAAPTPSRRPPAGAPHPLATSSSL